MAARDPKGLAGRDQSPLKVREVLAACFGLGAQVLGLSLGELPPVLASSSARTCSCRTLQLGYLLTVAVFGWALETSTGTGVGAVS